MQMTEVVELREIRRQRINWTLSAGTVETQEQLLAARQERGIKSTQATISRDINELHLMRNPRAAELIATLFRQKRV